MEIINNREQLLPLKMEEPRNQKPRLPSGSWTQRGSCPRREGLTSENWSPQEDVDIGRDLMLVSNRSWKKLCDIYTL